MQKMLGYVKNQNLGILFLRIALGVPFIVHGIAKLSSMDATVGFFTQIGFGSFSAWLVALVETIAGLAIVLGFMTEVAGILLAIVMLVAGIWVKMHLLKAGFLPSMTAPGYELDFILFFAALAAAFIGSGKWAVPSPWKCKCDGGCDCSTCNVCTPKTDVNQQKM